MKVRVFFVLAAFIILLAINKISLQNDIVSQNENFTTVNVSGKQRMYSQKITKLATYKIENFSSPDANNKVLEQTIAGFSEVHKNLENSLENYDSPVLNELYEELNVSYDNLTNSANKLLSENENIDVAKEHLNKVRVASSAFLPKMNEIVNTYERIGKDRGELILQKELTYNLIMIGILAYAFLFIILPLYNNSYGTEKLPVS